MFASRPLEHWSLNVLHAHLELRSLFLAAVFLFVLLIIAYLTNPSETSFRSYLTEQCFRHHLSRLDDASDDDHSDSEDSGVHYSSTPPRPPSSSVLLESGSTFHFSNRASVALRTPKHAFHSFAFFTIAAVIPTSRSRAPPAGTASHRPAPALADLDGSTPKESWFVGAFGRWWKGIEIPWPQRSPARSKCDEEGWSSGILNVKALDKSDPYNGLPFPTTSPQSHPRASPPKLRSRDRSNPRHNPSRNSSPPPLPKSATLPLHTPRQPSQSQSTAAAAAAIKAAPQAHAHAAPASPPCPPAAPTTTTTHARSPSATALPAPHAHAHAHAPSFEPTPAVAELLRQISHTRGANHDLRAQLAEHAALAATTDATLAAELAAARDAKRAEDAARGELRARTKALEDARRSAEAARRDAERRLRAAQTAQGDAGARIARLAGEVRALEEQMRRDTRAVADSRGAADAEERALQGALERRRREVQVAEEVVAALGVRARELEEAIGREGARLREARDRADMLRQDRAFLSLTVVKNQNQGADGWTPPPLLAPGSSSSPEHTGPAAAGDFDEVFPTALEKEHDSGSSASAGSRSRGVSASPRPRPLNLIPIASLAFNPTASALATPESRAPRAKGYARFERERELPPPTTTFSPFSDREDEDGGDEDEDDTHGGGGVTRSAPLNIAGHRAFVPPAASLIPHSLIRSLDAHAPLAGAVGAGAVSKSFQSENDVFLERDWRRRMPRHSDSSALPVGASPAASAITSAMHSPNALHTSPVSTTAPSAFPSVNGSGSAGGGGDMEEDYDPFEIRPPPVPVAVAVLQQQLHRAPRQRLVSDPLDMLQRAWPVRTHSDPAPPREGLVVAAAAASHTSARRWWSASTAGELGEREREKEREREREREKERRGLNPDAKVFRISRPPAFGSAAAARAQQQHQHQQQQAPAPPAFDTLNPSAAPGSTPFLPPSPTTTTTTTTTSTTSIINNTTTAGATATSAAPALFSGLAMRAFAPSPEEREALQRALGGSTNTSLERLPSLSEVGSGPASPAHVHALAQGHAHAHAHGHGHAHAQAGLALEMAAAAAAAKRSWLVGLAAPQGGKIRFSPWGDADGEDGAA